MAGTVLQGRLTPPLTDGRPLQTCRSSNKRSRGLYVCATVTAPQRLTAVTESEQQEAVAQIKKARLITALKTPYRADGKFDLRAYDQMLHHQICNGVEGVIVGGTTGEVALLQPTANPMTSACCGARADTVDNLWHPPAQQLRELLWARGRSPSALSFDHPQTGRETATQPKAAGCTRHAMLRVLTLHTCPASPLQLDALHEASRALMPTCEGLEAAPSHMSLTCRAGEGQLMSWDEHVMLIAHTVHTFGDQLHVIGNTGSNSTREALHATEQGFAVGMHAALQINPYYGKTSLDGLMSHFTALLNEGPAIIYNVPGEACPAEHAAWQGLRPAPVAALCAVHGPEGSAIWPCLTDCSQVGAHGLFRPAALPCSISNSSLMWFTDDQRVCRSDGAGHP